MEEPIRIQKVPDYPAKVRGNGKSGGDAETKKKNEKNEKNGKEESEPEKGHIDTLA